MLSLLLSLLTIPSVTSEASAASHRPSIADSQVSSLSRLRKLPFSTSDTVAEQTTKQQLQSLHYQDKWTVESIGLLLMLTGNLQPAR